MAIDTAAKRRNVSRMMQLSLLMGLSPSSGIDTDDRVNAARAYVGLSYSGPYGFGVGDLELSGAGYGPSTIVVGKIYRKDKRLKGI